MDIAIIIPTTAKAARAPFLQAAIASTLTQSAHRAVPMVAVNGKVYVAELLATLRADRRLRVLYREEPGEMAAIVAARALVDTEYFGVLDDDDLYLPDALATRVAAFAEHPPADAIVTNGIRRTEAGDMPFFEDFGAVAADPLGHLMRGSWMTPAGALFRTETVGADYFAAAPAMLEYTYLALRLAASRQLRFVDQQTFIKQELLPDALTRSPEYVLRQPHAIEQMMRLALPPAIRRQLREKLAASCHNVSALELSERNLSNAWRAHLKSLRSVYGLRYLAYTRHLIAPP